MRKNLAGLSYLPVMVATLQVGGCGLNETGTVPISLGSTGVFILQTGVPNENVITLTNLIPASSSVLDGSIRIDKDAISVTPDFGAPAKGNINLQARFLGIVVKIANTEIGKAVCEDGIPLGSFDVGLDEEDFVAVTITPAEEAFSEEAIEVLNERSSVMCITVTGDFSGRVEIDELVLTVIIGFAGIDLRP